MDKKFKFIELPSPEIELSVDGSAKILGGVICSIKYEICLDGKNGNCEIGPGGNTYNPNIPCGGNPTGCGDGMLCNEFGPVCGKLNCANYDN
ncbi:MAG: hypothetical protein HDS59_01325 [Barnesiella sp.]|nr:hypothetical protein [Barnesiella sp.]